MLSFWVPEIKDTPARVTIMEIPSRQECRVKNLFNVATVSIGDDGLCFFSLLFILFFHFVLLIWFHFFYLSYCFFSLSSSSSFFSYSSFSSFVSSWLPLLLFFLLRISFAPHFTHPSLLFLLPSFNFLLISLLHFLVFHFP